MLVPATDNKKGDEENKQQSFEEMTRRLKNGLLERRHGKTRKAY